MMIKINVEVPVYPTEDEEKVLEALHNIFPYDASNIQKKPGKEEITLLHDEDILYDVDREVLSLELEGAKPLMRMYELLRQFYIVETARSVFFSSKRVMDESVSRVSFSLNKQAALAGKLHFCGENESPLGSIDVIIESDALDHLINWLAPPTKDGIVLEPIHDELPF
ncbi:MAG: RNA-binding domain-containing protein [Candidatus Hodarchaeota archaeon]